MASAAGLEPTTHSLGNCCSILMSYADAAIFYYLLILQKSSYFLFFAEAKCCKNFI